MTLVKILIGNQTPTKNNKTTKNTTDTEPTWQKTEHKQELQEIIIATLIKNGEICGTEILAENLLKTEQTQKQTTPQNDKQTTLTNLNNALRKAREMAQNRGPLIYVKIDKAYYNTTTQ